MPSINSNDYNRVVSLRHTSSVKGGNVAEKASNFSDQPKVSEPIVLNTVGVINNQLLGVKGADGAVPASTKDGLTWNYSAELVTEDTLLKNEAGALVCNGNGGLKVVINNKSFVDDCGMKACSVKHEELHKRDVENNQPDICLGARDGQSIKYKDIPTELFYEKPAYDLSINCLEQLKEELSFFNFACSKSIGDEINQKVKIFKSRYGVDLQ